MAMVRKRLEKLSPERRKEVAQKAAKGARGQQRGQEEIMTNAQLLTLAVIFPLPMPLSSNSHITGAKETLRAELHAFRTEFSEKCKPCRPKAVNSAPG
jgi:hypothetical protein